MTEAQVNEVIKKLKEEGHDEEEILYSFYKMFQNDEITFDELEGLTEAIGYHITDDFRNMSAEDQKTKGYEEVEEVEDAKEVKDEEESDAMSLFGLGNKK